MNLFSQQRALQWRWASTLLLSAPSSNLLATASFLRYTFAWFYHSPTFPSSQYFLLFPSCRQPHYFPHRPSSSYSPLNILSSLVQVIDAIPKSFDSCYIDPFTCLSLPLSAVISSTPSTSSSHLSSAHVDTFRTPNLTPLLCSDLFYFDSLTIQLELRQPPLHQSRHPTLARQTLQSILSGSISFLPFLQHNRQPAPALLNRLLLPLVFLLSLPPSLASHLPFGIHLPLSALISFSLVLALPFNPRYSPPLPGRLFGL